MTTGWTVWIESWWGRDFPPIQTGPGAHPASCKMDTGSFPGVKWAGHVAHMVEESGVYRVLVGKPEGKRPLGRPRRRCVDNVGMDLQESRVGVWTGLGWPRIETGGGGL